jgi:hypothetical protein
LVESEKAPIKQRGFLGQLHTFLDDKYSALDDRANKLLLAAEIDSKMQELRYNFPGDENSPKFDINFTHTLLDTMKGKHQDEVIGNMLGVFSSMLKTVPPDQRDVCLEQIKDITKLASAFINLTKNDETEISEHSSNTSAATAEALEEFGQGAFESA